MAEATDRFGHYRVDVAFSVEASSPAMAIRKLMNALGVTVGESYMATMNAMAGVTRDGRLCDVDTSIALDDPRLIVGAYIGASNVSLTPNADDAFDDVAW